MSNLEFGIVVAGDTLSNGGTVTGATGSLMGGRNIALMGDIVFCLSHWAVPQAIVEGVDVFNNKKPIALHGHKVTCGCTLVATQMGSFAKIRNRATLSADCAQFEFNLTKKVSLFIDNLLAYIPIIDKVQTYLESLICGNNSTDKGITQGPLIPLLTHNSCLAVSQYITRSQKVYPLLATQYVDLQYNYKNPPICKIPPKGSDAVDFKMKESGYQIGVTKGGRSKNLWDEELKNPKPQNMYRVNNRNNYTTDSLGRTTRVQGEAADFTAIRNQTVQSATGKLVNPTGDQGGHLVGAQLGGTGDKVNTVPMDANLNQGKWKAMENKWADHKKAGGRVEYDMKIIYEDDSPRPARFEIKEYLKDKDGNLLSTDKFKWKNAPGGI